MDYSAQLAATDKKYGLPAGTMASITKQETGGKDDYIKDPAKYHYELNKDGKRIAGHTGKVSTAFGPFGILESTAKAPGYGVEPLRSKSYEDQLDFAGAYLAGRIKHAGSVQGGLAGYGEGAKYAAAVSSRLQRGSAPQSSDAPVSVVAPPIADDPSWPRLPTARDARRAGPDRTALKEQQQAQQDAQIAAGAAQVAEAGAGTEAQTEAHVQAAEALQRQRDETGVWETIGTARRDPRLNPMFTMLDAINAPSEVVPPDWSYAAERDKVEAGLTDDEREYIRENATGPQALERAKAQVAMRRDMDQQYGLAGGFSAFAGQMVAGAMDPIGFALGMGAGSALRGLGIGSQALATAGRPGAAASSFLLENAIANAGVEGVQDALGEVKTTADYAMAAATGAAMAVPFLPGAIRPADAAVQELIQNIRTAGANEREAAVTKVAASGVTDPATIARQVEQAEIEQIRTAVAEGQAPQVREQAVPESVQRAVREEEGDIAPLPPEPPAPEPVVPPFKVEVPGLYKQESKSTADRFTVREVLDEMMQHPNVRDIDKGVATYFRRLFNEDVLEGGVRFDPANKRGQYRMDTGETTVGTKLKGVEATVGEHLDFASPDLGRTLIHELVHQSTAGKIEAHYRGQDMGPLQKVLDQFADARSRYEDALQGHPLKGYDTDYAAKNNHEFAAMVLSDPKVREVLSGLPGKEIDGWKPSSAWAEVLGWLAKLLGLRKDTALSEATQLLDTIISTKLDVRDSQGNQVLYSPASSSNTAEGHSQALLRHAEDFVRRNPINTDRLKVITQKIGGLSDGLVLASSKNPIMKMVAALVTETTTGAAGRKPTVALRTHMLRTKLMGNGMVGYTHGFDQWAATNGKGVWDKYAKGDAKRAFDKEVYTEIVSRRDAAYQPTANEHVRYAADALEKVFTDARDAQVRAGVLGSSALPESSRGYVPQALDGNKLQNLSASDMELLHGELARQFESRLGWTAANAKEFAPFYVRRIRQRAQGAEGVDGLSAGGNAAEVVRDTLADMGINPEHRDKVSAMSAIFSGQGHTRKRLDLDLRVPLREGLDLMDLYVTDPLGLARNYTHRVAGNVALTESGILGVRGIRKLREAAGAPGKDGTTPTADEFAAFDRVMAEIMGTPVAGRVVSAGATNMGLAVNLQKLGGLVWTQAAETYQLANVLGFRSLTNGVASLPRLLKEVRDLKGGKAPSNSLLGSMEQYGGEWGADNYKMVAPLDPPDATLGQYMDQSGLASRLLRAGGHLQSKISGFRALMAAQHRMAAEQVTMKAARYIRDGGSDVALQDMGFTDAVVNGLKADLNKVAQWDANGNLKSFDLTQVSDPAVAEAFVQSVHRGVSQIIQGTYIGERNKWMHNDYLRLMLQLRTFGLTAAEKQWGRSRMNHGVVGAAGRLLGHMAMVLPIHAARVAFNAQGREDKEKFLKDNLSAVAIARATMNYASLAGLAGDVMDIGTGIWAGVGDDQTKELLGARTQGTGVAQVIPAAGVIDQALKTVQGKGTVYSTLKQAPFGSLWWMVPAVNLTKEE